MNFAFGIQATKRYIGCPLRKDFSMDETIRINATAQGVLIPRQLLEGIEEVTIKKEDGVIVIVPTVQNDPIWNLGKDPIKCDVSDASEQHDKYLYGKSS